MLLTVNTGSSSYLSVGKFICLTIRCYGNC